MGNTERDGRPGIRFDGEAGLTIPAHTGLMFSEASGDLGLVVDGREVIRLTAGGAILVQGRQAESDAELVAVLRETLAAFRGAMHREAAQ